MTIFEIYLFGFHIAPTYYWLAYAVGIYLAYFWIERRKIFSEKELDALLSAVVGGIILWWRLGYVLFYNPLFYFSQPWKVFAIYEWWMSFHGGIIGVILWILWFSRKYKKPLLEVGDIVAITVPIGIFLGRIANYLNGELRWYAGYNWPFAMMHQGVSYFPSPLLEAFLEGILLLILLLSAQRISSRRGVVSGVFLLGYGCMRLFVEYGFRLPDAQIGYIAGIFTLGQLLSIPLVLSGGWILWNAYKSPEANTTPASLR